VLVTQLFDDLHLNLQQLLLPTQLLVSLHHLPLQLFANPQQLLLWDVVVDLLVIQPLLDNAQDFIVAEELTLSLLGIGVCENCLQ